MRSILVTLLTFFSITSLANMMGGMGVGMGGEYIFPMVPNKTIQISGSEEAVAAYKSEKAQGLRKEIMDLQKEAKDHSREIALLQAEMNSMQIVLAGGSGVSAEVKASAKKALAEAKSHIRDLQKDMNQSYKEQAGKCAEYEEKFANKYHSLEGAKKNILSNSDFRCKDGEKMAGTDNSDNPCYYPQDLSTTPAGMGMSGMGCGMGMMGMPSMGPGMMGMPGGGGGTPLKTAVCVDKDNKVTASALYTIGKMGDHEFAIVQGNSRFIMKGSKVVGIEREEYSGSVKTTVEFNERNTKVTQMLAGKKTKQCTYEKEVYPAFGISGSGVPAVR